MRTDYHNAMLLQDATAISRRRPAAVSRPADDGFSRSLEAASIRLVSDGNQPQPTSDASRTGGSDQRTEQTVVSEALSHPIQVVTPFGIFDWAPPPAEPAIEVAPRSMARDYFLTHQPAEWADNPEIRASFAELYGQKALVTLDWTGTVPENVLDEVWVTHTAIDAIGRPLLKLEEMT